MVAKRSARPRVFALRAGSRGAPAGAHGRDRRDLSGQIAAVQAGPVTVRIADRGLRVVAGEEVRRALDRASTSARVQLDAPERLRTASWSASGRSIDNAESETHEIAKAPKSASVKETRAFAKKAVVSTTCRPDPLKLLPDETAAGMRCRAAQTWSQYAQRKASNTG